MNATDTVHLLQEVLNHVLTRNGPQYSYLYFDDDDGFTIKWDDGDRVAEVSVGSSIATPFHWWFRDRNTESSGGSEKPVARIPEEFFVFLSTMKRTL